MLLTQILRRRAAGPDQRDRGSALAAVVGIVAISGVMAATLLTAATFSTGFTSATRAGVQAQAAAEGGLDYARANLSACNGAPITNPAGTQPVFAVTVAYRTRTSGAWTPACDATTLSVPTDAVQVRLTSTGSAQHTGAAGHTRGNTRTMEAVYTFEFPFLVHADHSLALNGSFTVHDTAARPADMNTNGSLYCGGSITLKGVIHVAGTTSSCPGVVTAGGIDPTVAPHAFPRLTSADPRWPKTPATLTPSGSCSPSGARTLARSVIQCAGTLDLSGVQFTLTGDVVIFASQIAVNDLNVRSSGGRFSLYLVNPWPATQSACPAAVGGPDVQGKKIVTDDFSSVMLYSSTEIQLDSPEGMPVRLQLLGCQVDTKGSPKFALAPTGPLVLQSKRDITG